jgi:hypothetical protein
MAAFDRPGGKGLFLPSVVGSIPGNPTGFRPNWGASLTAGLVALLLPHPSGFYFDIVKGRIATFAGANANAIVPVRMQFGVGYQMGAAAGGQIAYAALQDGTLEPPTPIGLQGGMSVAAGAYNQGVIGNVVCGFAGWQDTTSQANRMTIYCGNSGGTPRMQVIVDVAGVGTNIIANGGAGITMVTAGQYMSYAASYNGSTILADYTSTGLGHQIGSGAGSGWPAKLVQASISDFSSGGFNSGRTMIWVGMWNRPLSAVELQTVTSYIGGLPPMILRAR